jgi:hypothetical protein
MNKLVDVIFNLYKKCQILGTTPTKVKNQGKKRQKPLKYKKLLYIHIFVLHSNWGLKKHQIW